MRTCNIKFTKRFFWKLLRVNGDNHWKILFESVEKLGDAEISRVRSGNDYQSTIFGEWEFFDTSNWSLYLGLFESNSVHVSWKCSHSFFYSSAKWKINFATLIPSKTFLSFSFQKARPTAAPKKVSFFSLNTLHFLTKRPD